MEKKILIPVAYFRKLRLRNFNLLIANSSYLCNKVSRYNNSVEILYPFVDPIDSKKGSNDRKYLTFLNPSREKGIRIFISIAEKLQNKSFMVVGKISSKNRMILQRMENVTYVPWTNEINKIYHDTRILLVPSISTETFGRVVIEAAQFGIPAIVSNQGGLPEAIGKSGLLVDNIFDVSEWLNNIQKFDDAQFYNSMSDEARKHAKNFYTNNINQSFRSILFRNFNLRF
ncbi:MAG: glycosyltransferase family 4 protein [Calditrichaceae bacterium]|nr:glycosyltransferase family 4 protein [Calditrichaceae bacterium]RQV95575.1 MAG: glycosyltransferase [Calditrichota bacterium]